ncbi:MULTISPECIES: hypothetical protein [Providencia]|uniref:hypothetical protein n=1 Tax=Providencia TaxID=586 RepID=UPI00155E5EF0|nr:MULTISPECIES: hypothetical protein [Providencia]MBG5922556.1 hypothetical protein [Providencia rettgeri]QKG45328.1 hypothetical protein HRD55_12330 [Providencia rettgeri]QNN31564.1 hypothetical protein H9X60_12330 [Providencia rettgeri]HEM8210034.1 hypothetical protein [Providencia rettgeri]
MKLQTKNFRLNALANNFSAAIYHDVTTRNGGDWFPMNVGNKTIEVAIIDGVRGIRMLVDSYLLGALKQAYPTWEAVAIGLIEQCVINGYVTGYGREVWESMINDMGDSLADKGAFQ